MKTCMVHSHDGPCKDGAWFCVCLLRNLLQPLPLLLEATLLAWLRFLLPGPLVALWGGVGRCWRRCTRAETPSYRGRLPGKDPRYMLREQPLCYGVGDAAPRPQLPHRRSRGVL